jgi:hypothetical protein
MATPKSDFRHTPGSGHCPPAASRSAIHSNPSVRRIGSRDALTFRRSYGVITGSPRPCASHARNAGRFLKLLHTGVVLIFRIQRAVSGTNLAHERTCATRARGGGRCFRLHRVALSQSGRSRDGEDSKTNKDDFLHVRLPRKRRTAVNHKPWIRVKNRSQSEPSLSHGCSGERPGGSNPPHCFPSLTRRRSTINAAAARSPVWSEPSMPRAPISLTSRGKKRTTGISTRLRVSRLAYRGVAGSHRAGCWRGSYSDGIRLQASHTRH